MTMHQKAIFCVVLSEGNRWSVEAEWPDGTIELVTTFKTHTEAVEWLDKQSHVWLDWRSTASVAPTINPASQADVITRHHTSERGVSDLMALVERFAAGRE
jgi:hypothetical protein